MPGFDELRQRGRVLQGVAVCFPRLSFGSTECTALSSQASILASNGTVRSRLARRRYSSVRSFCGPPAVQLVEEPSAFHQPLGHQGVRQLDPEAGEAPGNAMERRSSGEKP